MSWESALAAFESLVERLEQAVTDEVPLEVPLPAWEAPAPPTEPPNAHQVARAEALLARGAACQEALGQSRDAVRAGLDDLRVRQDAAASYRAQDAARP